MLVALAQVAGEVQRAVAVDLVVDPLNLIQHVAHFARRELGVAQEIRELFKRALEVDVVFPQGIVGVEDQPLAIGLGHHFATRGARWKGISKTASTSTARPLRSAGSNTHWPSASAALRSSRTSRCWISATPS